MKEKEIELSREEVRYLLLGTIHWQDIVQRDSHTQRSSSGIRKLGEPLAERPKPSVKRPEDKDAERFELNQVLLGNNKELRMSSFDGKGVIFFITAVGIITISTWAYFVFAG